MANGFDAVNNKYRVDSDHHMEVFDAIKEKSDTGEFKVLINEVILTEWERNKKQANSYQNKLKSSLKKEPLQLVDQKDSLGHDVFKSKCKEIQQNYKDKIQQNKNHVESIEEFIKACDSFEINDNIKLEIVNLAIEKTKAPFLNSKNNCADAAILFGAIEFLKENMIQGAERAVFVSSNYKEYGTTKESNNFHPDIKIRSDQVNLDYHQNLGDLLELTEELLTEIETFHELIRESQQYFSCQSYVCESNENFSGFGYLDTPIRVTKQKDQTDPNQLELFQKEELPTPLKTKFVFQGNCVVCQESHIECPDCKSLLIDLNEADQYYCDYCELNYELSVCPQNHDKIIYPISIEEMHL